MATTEINVNPPPEPQIVQTTKRGGTERFPWQRLTLSLLGIAFVFLMWRWATLHLYVLPPHAIVAFNSITNNAFYVLGALVIFFVTGRLVYEWKNQTVSTVIDQAENIFEKREEKIEQVITTRTEGGAKAFGDDEP